MDLYTVLMNFPQNFLKFIQPVYVIPQNCVNIFQNCIRIPQNPQSDDDDDAAGER